MKFLDEDFEHYLLIRQVADACITGAYLWQVWEKKGAEEAIRMCDLLNNNVAKCIKEKIVKEIAMQEKGKKGARKKHKTCQTAAREL